MRFVSRFAQSFLLICSKHNFHFFVRITSFSTFQLSCRNATCSACIRCPKNTFSSRPGEQQQQKKNRSKTRNKFIEMVHRCPIYFINIFAGDRISIFFFVPIRRWHFIFRLSTIHKHNERTNEKRKKNHFTKCCAFGFFVSVEFVHIAAAAADDYFICKFSRESIYWNNQMTNVTPIDFMNIYNLKQLHIFDVMPNICGRLLSATELNALYRTWPPWCGFKK